MSWIINLVSPLSYGLTFPLHSPLLLILPLSLLLLTDFLFTISLFLLHSYFLLFIMSSFFSIPILYYLQFHFHISFKSFILSPCFYFQTFIFQFFNLSPLLLPPLSIDPYSSLWSYPPASPSIIYYSYFTFMPSLITASSPSSTPPLGFSSSTFPVIQLLPYILRLMAGRTEK